MVSRHCEATQLPWQSRNADAVVRSAAFLDCHGQTLRGLAMTRALFGFSLPELLITFVIIAIISLFAIPTYQTLITKTQDHITSAQLQRAISLLRSEANSRGTSMTLCASSDQQSCSGNWQDGQIIFVDKNQEGKVSAPENIIYHFNSPAHKDKLHWRSALNHEYLQILPSGLTSGENGTFWNCHPQEKTPSWALIISQSGRARLADNSELNALTC